MRKHAITRVEPAGRSSGARGAKAIEKDGSSACLAELLLRRVLWLRSWQLKRERGAVHDQRDVDNGNNRLQPSQPALCCLFPMLIDHSHSTDMIRLEAMETKRNGWSVLVASKHIQVSCIVSIMVDRPRVSKCGTRCLSS